MKKIGLGALIALVLAGCGGDDGAWTVDDYCSAAFEKSYNFSSLPAAQQKELRTFFMDSCKSFFDGLPFCEEEFIADGDCQYHLPKGYFDRKDVEDIKDKCEKESEIEGAVNACLIKSGMKCSKEAVAAESCEREHRDAINNYYNTHTNPNKAMSNKLQSMGLNIENYRI
ncbi:MAG: hypothetical protein J6A01_11310 [Proteobacteria bacterium]|nr:hypothetical protein [Pseudomonadota bacterium]